MVNKFRLTNSAPVATPMVTGTTFLTAHLLRFLTMPTTLGHTPLFLTRTLDVILTSL